MPQRTTPIFCRYNDDHCWRADCRVNACRAKKETDDRQFAAAVRKLDDQVAKSRALQQECNEVARIILWYRGNKRPTPNQIAEIAARPDTIAKAKRRIEELPELVERLLLSD